MKPGDTFAVRLQDWDVAEATVVSFEDGQVTLDIPATRVVMGVRTSLADLEERTPEREQQVIGDTRVEPQGSGKITPEQTGTPTNNEQVVYDSAKTPVVEEVPPPVMEPRNVQTRTLSSDDIGEGLHGRALPEME